MAIPVRLKVFKGDVLVTSQEFERDLIKIGRLASAHLCLEDEAVSRIHSVIAVESDGSLSITDMGSAGGTHVNGKRVSKGRLSFGDEIKVGGTTIRLERLRGVAALDVAPEPVPEVVQAPVEVPVPAAPPEPPSVPRVRRAVPRKGRGPLGVSLRFQWGDQNVGEFFIAPGARKGFSVGTAAGVDFVMGDARLGGPSFEVLRTDGQAFTVCFTGRMRGGLTRNGETRDLEAVLESGLASHEGESYALSLETEDFLWMDLGGVTLEVCFQPVPRRAEVPLTESLDFTVVNIFLVTFFLAAFFVISAAHQGADGSAYADELAGDSSRIAKLIVKAPEAQQRNRLLRQLDDKKREEVARRPSRPREDGGPPARTPPRAVTERLPAKGQRGGAVMARAAVRDVFGGSGISSLFQGPGNTLASALKRVDGGPRTSANGAFGMLGPRTGLGAGSGGGIIGIGPVSTRGRSTGETHYVNGAERLGSKRSADVAIASEDVQVSNPMDRELIRQVIQRNRGQIRYCYESQLNRHPELSGKVAIRFTIASEGNVVTSSVAQSTAGNAELEQCVASRVRGWQFPKPKGGGHVVVTYPFLFKQAGE